MAKFKTLTEAGVTTPCSLNADVDSLTIKNAKVVKDSKYKLMNLNLRYDAGILNTKTLNYSGLRVS